MSYVGKGIVTAFTKNLRSLGELTGLFKQNATIESSPTYDPALAEKIKTFRKALAAHYPDKNFSPLKALKKAYEAKHPTTAQLKTISYGNALVQALPKTVPDPSDPQKTISLSDDELIRISKLATIAEKIYETTSGNFSPVTIEYAQRLTGDRPHNSPDTPPYIESLNHLITGLWKEGNNGVCPEFIIKKIEQASNAIYNISAISTSDDEKMPTSSELDQLINLRGYINKIDDFKLAFLEKRPKGINKEKAEEITNNITDLLRPLIEVNDSKLDGPLALRPAARNMLTYIENSDKGFDKKSVTSNDLTIV